MNIPNLYGQVQWTPTELSRSKRSFFNNFSNSPDYQLGHKQPINESE